MFVICMYNYIYIYINEVPAGLPLLRDDGLSEGRWGKFNT